MNRTLLIALASLATLLASCATPPPPVRSDYDHGVNFSAFHTFGFPENTGTDRGGYTTLVTSHFKDAVRREMTVRGYTYAETAPDLLVNFYSQVRDKTQIYSYPYPGPFFGTVGFHHGRPRYG
ncbi:MAG TPA: DUF4136 domain-containing protein, partial [Steroidobacteraceae bacterium]|nr:DUF4136 domain-containing protein [Steroidobacteraceae bacterium]